MSSLSKEQCNEPSGEGSEECREEEEAKEDVAPGPTEEAEPVGSKSELGKRDREEDAAATPSSPASMHEKRRKEDVEHAVVDSQISNQAADQPVDNQPTDNQVTDNSVLQGLLTRTQERVTLLETLLHEREREAAKLQQQQNNQQFTAAQPATQPAISESELKQAYCKSVQALKDYVTLSGLLSYDISGKNLPEKIIVDLKVLIHQISKVCLQVMKPETPVVLELISKDYSSATVNDWELDKSHWINVIAQLQLTDQQVMTILKCREQHVAGMLLLYQERVILCRQAAEMASKSATISSGVPGGNHGGAEDDSMLGVLMRQGYLYCARNMVRLHRLLELVKENMQKEQRAIMEVFLKVVYQILSPVQAAIFVVESFPYHCDILALANILSMVFGKDMGMASGPSISQQAGSFQVGRAGSGGLGFGKDGGMAASSMGSQQAAGMPFGGGSGGAGSMGLPGGMQFGGSSGAGGAGGQLPQGGLGGLMAGQGNAVSSLGGGGAGTDAETVASWMQMQGAVGMAGPSQLGGPAGPGGSSVQGGVDSGAPSAEGLNRLKKFLDSAGQAAALSQSGGLGGGGGPGGGGGLAPGSGLGGVPWALAMDGAGGSLGALGAAGMHGHGQDAGMGQGHWSNIRSSLPGSGLGGGLAGASNSGLPGKVGLQVGFGGAAGSQMQQLQHMQQLQQLQLQQQQQQQQQQLHLQQQAGKMGLSLGIGKQQQPGLGGLQGQGQLASHNGLGGLMAGGGMLQGLSGNFGGMGQMGGAGMGTPGGLGGDMGGLGNSSMGRMQVPLQQLGGMGGLDLSATGGMAPGGSVGRL